MNNTSQLDAMIAEINNAIKNNVPEFEFKGDYNWKYAATYANTAALKVFEQIISNTVRQYISEHPQARRKLYNDNLSYKDFIKIKKRSEHDRIHIYGELYLDDLTDKIIDTNIECENLKIHQQRQLMEKYYFKYNETFLLEGVSAKPVEAYFVRDGFAYYDVKSSAMIFTDDFAPILSGKWKICPITQKYDESTISEGLNRIDAQLNALKEIIYKEYPSNQVISELKDYEIAIKDSVTKQNIADRANSVITNIKALLKSLDIHCER